MTKSDPYKTPRALRRALDTHFGTLAAQAAARGEGAKGSLKMRYMQRFVTEVYLARMLERFGSDTLVLKGGHALELRLERARATKDLDIQMSGSPEDVLEALQPLGASEQGFLSFLTSLDPNHPTMEGDGIVYEGRRLRVTAQLDGKAYGAPFGLDILFDAPVEETSLRVGVPSVLGPKVLSRAGLEPREVRLYPMTLHLAEKLHAYTFEYQGRENTRTKDLPDIALLASAARHDASRLLEALHHTFERRATHQLPMSLPAAPDAWRVRYQEMVRAYQLPWENLDALHSACASFLDPLLRGDIMQGALWSPEFWRWES